MTIPEPPPHAGRRWWALALIATAQFMIIMDTSIIGVALPRMQADLGFSSTGLSWVFNAYVIALGGLLLLGGRLADLFGARRVFTTGWLVLLAGSAVAGAAGTVPVELLGRALQGAGSALIAPAALTLLMMLFGDKPRELTTALAFYGAAAPAGGTAGVFLGGVLTQYLSWPWVFYINIPVAVLVLLATPALMPSGGARPGTIDGVGAVTATAGLAVAVYAIVRAPEVGWGTAQTWTALAGAALLLGIFVAVQATHRQPLMRLSIFRAPNLAAANVAQLLLGAAWIPLWFFLNLYLQQVLGYSAFPSGAALLPMTVLIMVLMVGVAPPLLARIGPKPMIIAGLVALAGGLVWLSFVRPGGSFVVDVLPASLVAALGQALAFIPSLGTAISAARPEEGGLASGIVNTSYQVGSALGLAAMTALAAASGATQVGDPVALTDGFAAAFLGAAGIAAAGALIIAGTFRRTAADDAATAAPDQEPAFAAATAGPAHPPPDPVPASTGAGWQPLTDDLGSPAPSMPGPAEASPATMPVAARPNPVAPATPSTADGVSRISGTVLRPHGGGVDSAAVTLIDKAGQQAARTTSGPEGRYELVAPAPGDYVLIAAAAGHKPDVTTVVVDHQPVEVVLTLTGAAELVGTITAAATATPITGATATLTDDDGDVIGSDVTETDGQYQLAMLAAGSYTLVISAESYQPAASLVPVPDSGRHRHDVALVGDAELSGVVRAVDGHPVAHARVTLVDPAGALVDSLETDERGHYRFTGLDVGDYTLSATGYPAVTHQVVIDRKTGEHDVELHHDGGNP